MHLETYVKIKSELIKKRSKYNFILERLSDEDFWINESAEGEDEMYSIGVLLSHKIDRIDEAIKKVETEFFYNANLLYK